MRPGGSAHAVLRIKLERSEGLIRDNGLDSLASRWNSPTKVIKIFCMTLKALAFASGMKFTRNRFQTRAGMVPAGKVQTAFFVVTGTASGSRNDLAVTNKFEVVLRQVIGDVDPHRKVT